MSKEIVHGENSVHAILPGVPATTQISERVWQAWLYKNRELDRIGAARRLKGLKIVLALLAVVALFRGFSGQI